MIYKITYNNEQTLYIKANNLTECINIMLLNLRIKKEELIILNKIEEKEVERSEN